MINIDYNNNKLLLKKFTLKIIYVKIYLLK